MEQYGQVRNPQKSVFKFAIRRASRAGEGIHHLPSKGKLLLNRHFDPKMLDEDLGRPKKSCFRVRTPCSAFKIQYLKMIPYATIEIYLKSVKTPTIASESISSETIITGALVRADSIVACGVAMTPVRLRHTCTFVHI